MERKMRQRWLCTPDHMDLVDLVGTVREAQAADGLPDDSPARVSRGTFVKWYSPETDQELMERVASEERHALRHEKWERETYERLKEKYG